MSRSASRLHRELIQRARSGDEQALGHLLDRHRPYLKLLAQREIEGRLDARIDGSDLVQQTCLSALRRFEEFVGEHEEQFIAWLRAIHEGNIRDTIRRHIYTAKRAVGVERRQDGSRNSEDPVDKSSASPSRRMLHGEAAVRLAETLSRLPDDQCEAVRLRHLEGWSLARMAARFKRSETAVAALVKRGLANLRKYLVESD